MVEHLKAKTHSNKICDYCIGVIVFLQSLKVALEMFCSCSDILVDYWIFVSCPVQQKQSTRDCNFPCSGYMNMHFIIWILYHEWHCC